MWHSGWCCKTTLNVAHQSEENMLRGTLWWTHYTSNRHGSLLLPSQTTEHLCLLEGEAEIRRRGEKINLPAMVVHSGDFYFSLLNLRQPNTPVPHIYAERQSIHPHAFQQDVINLDPLSLSARQHPNRVASSPGSFLPSLRINISVCTPRSSINRLQFPSPHLLKNHATWQAPLRNRARFRGFICVRATEESRCRIGERGMDLQVINPSAPLHLPDGISLH